MSNSSWFMKLPKPEPGEAKCMKALRILLFDLGVICLASGCADLSHPTNQTTSQLNQPSALEAEKSARERISMRIKIAELMESQRASPIVIRQLDAPRLYVADENLPATLTQMQLVHQSILNAPSPADESTIASQATPAIAARESVGDSTASPVSFQAPPNSEPASPAALSASVVLNPPAIPEVNANSLHPEPAPPTQPALVAQPPVLTPTGKDNPYPLKERYENKQRKLKELLELYRTDRITPGEYHRQRSQILSESDAP